MPTIITLLAIAIVIVIVIVFLMVIIWVICVAAFIKIIGKAIRENDELLADDWEDTDKHPWINGDCCRCTECTKQFHDELLGDLESTTDINHNLRNNR